MRIHSSRHNTTDTLPTGLHLGKYEIQQVLGQGGFGITYLALDRESNEQVVIKENLPAQFAGRNPETLTVSPRGGREGADNFAWAMRRFLEEAQLLASLQHPNIIRVQHTFSALGTAYYVMPWVHGYDLMQIAAQLGTPLPGDFLRKMLEQLLPALSYLHSHNRLHRDIKPNNILCTEDGSLLFIDFGAARALVSERTHTRIESPGYTPIEQIQSNGNIGPWTDLYALGATLYALIAGTPPPPCTDRMGLTDNCVQLARLEQLHAVFDYHLLAGIDKALAVWPEDRWRCAEEWMASLSRQPLTASASTIKLDTRLPASPSARPNSPTRPAPRGKIKKSGKAEREKIYGRIGCALYILAPLIWMLLWMLLDWLGGKN